MAKQPEQPEQQCESATCPPEKYAGDEVDSVVIEGSGTMYAKEIRILLKNGKAITAMPDMMVWSKGLTAQIKLSRGGWARIGEVVTATENLEKPGNS